MVIPICAAGGLVSGPALSVVVDRVPAGGSPGSSRSGSSFWKRAATLSIVSSAVLGGFAWRIGPHVPLVAYLILGLGLLSITAVDLDRQLVPIRLLYPTLLGVSTLLVIAAGVDHTWSSLGRGAAVGGGAFVIFFVIHFVAPRGMGFGDVRLAGLIGLSTGWLGSSWRDGIGHGAVAFFASFLLAAVIGVGLMMAKGYGRKAKIPFAPFLSAGAVISVLWGSPLVHVWLHG